MNKYKQQVVKKLNIAYRQGHPISMLVQYFNYYIPDADPAPYIALLDFPVTPSA